MTPSEQKSQKKLFMFLISFAFLLLFFFTPIPLFFNLTAILSLGIIGGLFVYQMNRKRLSLFIILSTSIFAVIYPLEYILFGSLYLHSVARTVAVASVIILILIGLLVVIAPVFLSGVSEHPIGDDEV